MIGPRAISLLRAPALRSLASIARPAAVARPTVAMFSSEVSETGRDAVKETTGLTGLDVVPNARRVLISLYGQILEAAEAIPEGNQYRADITQLTKYRLSVVESNNSISAIEAEINDGQIEELIDIAKDELELLPKFASWASEGFTDVDLPVEKKAIE